MKRLKLIPKIITILKEGYNFKNMLNDLSAGIIVGIVALPLSIAFAIASGVKPEQGLYTAIIAGFIISLLSGSRVQIGGPTGAFIVILYSIVSKYGYDGLVIATIIAGIFLILMGLSNLGAVIKFIPFPVTVGFTSGIAVIIAVTQIKDFLGLKINNVPAEFFDKIFSYYENINSADIYSISIGIAALLILIFWKKITYKIPGSIVAIIIMTSIVYYFKLPVETIGSKFGNVPSNFPMPKIPHINFKIIKDMIQPAISIAFLAGIESLLSAVVADGMMGTKHKSNMELVAQGVANIISPIFGGIPATGAIARTATNIKNGGKTPFAGIFHSITLLLIMLFFGKYASLIPMPVLAAILLIVAYNMSEAHIFIKLLKSPRSDVLVLVITFILTIVLDLTIAIEVGIVLASFLFMYKMSNVTQAEKISIDDLTDSDEEEDPDSISKKEIPSGVEVFEIYGSLFFGAADKVVEEFNRVFKKPKALIVRMRHVMIVDATGLKTLENIYHATKKQGTCLILSGVRSQVLFAMQRSNLIDKITDENICPNLDYAITRAKVVLNIKDSQIS